MPIIFFGRISERDEILKNIMRGHKRQFQRNVHGGDRGEHDFNPPLCNSK